MERATDHHLLARACVMCRLTLIIHALAATTPEYRVVVVGRVVVQEWLLYNGREGGCNPQKVAHTSNKPPASSTLAQCFSKL